MSLFKRFARIVQSEVTSRLSPPTSPEDRSVYQNSTSTGAPATESPTVSDEKTYLANLELHPGATLEQIRGAHKRLLKKYHPDFHHNNEEMRQTAENIVQQLNEARDYFEEKHKG